MCKGVVQLHVYIYFDASGSVDELFSLGGASVRSRDFDGSKGRQRVFIYERQQRCAGKFNISY